MPLFCMHKFSNNIKLNLSKLPSGWVMAGFDWNLIIKIDYMNSFSVSFKALFQAVTFEFLGIDRDWLLLNFIN